MAENHNDQDDLPAWEPCAQCSQVEGNEGIIEYSGAEDTEYLCCSSCRKYVHPTCDKITDPDGVFRYFCLSCRAKLNKKIAWKRKKPQRKNSLNQPIDSPIPENASNLENEKEQLTVTQKSQEKT